MTEELTTTEAPLDQSDISTTELTKTVDEVPVTESIFNISNIEPLLHSTPSQDDYYSIFEAFNIMEIIMTSVEMMVWIVAAYKMPRWRKNYRNQMLIQISVARFVKRIILSFKFLEDNNKISSTTTVNAVLNSSQFYIDFVIVILVFFFIKHMYDSLIIVLVKVRQNSLYKVSLCSWLVPIPISAVWTAIIVVGALDKWIVYLLICCIFRWPLIFLGTVVYITVVYRVLSEKIRRFAWSLTLVTFLMCLMINFYLFSKDVIELWCIGSFATRLVSYLSGLIMNFLILSFYIILIWLDYKHCNQTSPNINCYIPNYSVSDVA